VGLENQLHVLEVRDREIAKLRHQLLNEISALKAAVEELETRQLE